MTIRCVSLFAAVALAGLAAPALAQGARYDPGLPPPLPEQGAWEEEWVEEAYEDEGYGDERVTREVRVYRHDGPHADPGHNEPDGYSPEQLAWLDQCRAERGGRGEERGEVVGGVLGAVAGGVAGNRIAGRGDRLAGTLVGAGVGALAGAAVGGAVGRDSDRDRLGWCEDYMARYYAGYRDQGDGYGLAREPHGYGPGPYAHAAYPVPGFGYAYPYPYPVVWVRVPIVTERRGHDCGCEVVETVIEERVERPAPPPPRRTKMVRIRTVK